MAKIYGQKRHNEKGNQNHDLFGIVPLAVIKQAKKISLDIEDLKLMFSNRPTL